jgi:2-polyprenyl-6-methoxyphenol hydroxylase-like FAD-dependent oxidoreductase
VTIAAAAERASSGRFKTLIVGGGIAGLSLAALLQRWDERPVIVEHAAASHAIGYNLGIYPVGAGILHGLGLFSRFVEASEVLRKYELYNGVGQQVAQWDLTGLFGHYGPIRGIRRAELIDLLASTLAGDQIIYTATIGAIEPSGEKLRVTFNDGSVGSFDLVVGADGINSHVRELIVPPTKIHTFDTQWGCLVSWAAANLLPADTTREYWGAGFFIGLYSVKGEIGVVVAGPRAALEENRAGFFGHVRCHLKDVVATSTLDLVEEDPDPFFWKLLDVRADDWTRGRVVLLGDAADAFLPTAGIGASMAMLSAAALADELSRSDAAHLPAALQRYQRRQQPKVIAAQQNSRKLAHLMMVQSPVMAWGRETLMHFYGPDRALNDIIKVMDGIV